MFGACCGLWLTQSSRRKHKKYSLQPECFEWSYCAENLKTEYDYEFKIFYEIETEQKKSAQPS